ncbi:MAG: hypothetical protein U0169_10300 [Polyangiaceae bacterium]
MDAPETESAEVLLGALGRDTKSVRPRPKGDSAGRDYASFSSPPHAPPVPRTEDMDVPSVVVAGVIPTHVEVPGAFDGIDAAPSHPPVAFDDARDDERPLPDPFAERIDPDRLNGLIAVAASLSVALFLVSFVLLRQRGATADLGVVATRAHVRVDSERFDRARVLPRRGRVVVEDVAPATPAHRRRPRTGATGAGTRSAPAPTETPVADLLENDFPH